MKRVALIGTGNIAHAHAQALQQIKGAHIAAVMDVAEDKAATFAGQYKIPAHFTSFEELQRAASVDVAHVLTPPPTHYAIAREILEHGVSVFLEKPMAETVQECRALQDLAKARLADLRVNQNYVFAPAHTKLRSAFNAGKIGPVRSITCEYSMPLRQLTARQFGHWMFNSPLNLLLEQAVHPLSLIDELTGPLTVETVWHGPAHEFAPGVPLITEWQIAMTSGAVAANLHIKLGANYPDWTVTVLGDDGKIVADHLTGTTMVDTPGAYIDFAEQMRKSAKRSASTMVQGAAGSTKYLASQFGILKRSDDFFLSIRDSIASFYKDLTGGRENLAGQQGARLVGLCSDIAAKTRLPEKETATASPSVQTGTAPRILLLGGTGFIGSYLTRQLLREGEAVRVVARGTNNLPAPFHDENVSILRGSIADTEFLANAMEGIECVVNLAHGGGGDSWQAIYQALVGGAEAVAMTALKAGVSKFLHVGSIAALYLGDPSQTVTHETPVDPERELRAHYSRAKAEADLSMMRLHKDEGLPASIFRPGVVLGAGTSPFHSGIGFYNRDQICLGWNNGRNPLPLVLVEDVATALRHAILKSSVTDLEGQCFNLVGDVRLSARDYTEALAVVTKRSLKFRPQPLWQQQFGEITKWGIKRVGGRQVEFPSVRDLKSRGMVSPIDTTFEKKRLHWTPVHDRAIFIEQAIRVHASAV